ncbi:hypothetical protein BDZ91DRAFT_794562 [Kalaharituber pfeilii]|nr:hypothetical protein BDZ91DRAFT_794562 [Kalaharituber pfeilii]
MDEDNANSKKWKMKWKRAYWKVTQAKAEKGLGFRMEEISTVPKAKEEVYNEPVKYFDVEGFPTPADEDVKESSINDLVYSIISTPLLDVRRETGRKKMKLRREKDITAVDTETGSSEEFIMMDYMPVMDEKFIPVIEAKRYSIKQAMRQCLLSMRDMWDNIDEGEVYGFVTTGERWQMLRYDGKPFRKARNITALFEGMDWSPSP